MTPISVIFDAVDAVADSIRDGAGPLDVLHAIRPLLLEFAFSDVILTDDRIAAVQDRVHRTLRDAGLLVGRDLK